jgi:hypothetical protein
MSWSPREYVLSDAHHAFAWGEENVNVAHFFCKKESKFWIQSIVQYLLLHRIWLFSIATCIGVILILVYETETKMKETKFCFSVG